MLIINDDIRESIAVLRERSFVQHLLEVTVFLNKRFNGK
jgi:hypothetical protein